VKYLDLKEEQFCRARARAWIKIWNPTEGTWRKREDVSFKRGLCWKVECARFIGGATWI